MYQFNREEYNKRMEWYVDARFGMFIHWGLYSIPARGEWVRSVEEIPKEDYMKYFYEFDPMVFVCLIVSIQSSSLLIQNAAAILLQST